jgi:hypothetical protein
MRTSSNSKIYNFIYSILKEIISDDEGCMLVIELLDDGLSLEDISEFVMRKFLKNSCNNYYFQINEILNKVVDNKFVEEDDEEDNIIADNNPKA